jgi:biotin carboxyl carrier protein
MSEEMFQASSKAYDDLFRTYNSHVKNLDDAIVEAQNELILATIALSDAERRHTNIAEDYAEASSDILNELSFISQVEKIDAKKAEIEELREKSVGGEVVAPIAGTVSMIAHVAGDSMQMGDTVATIQPAGRGFTASFSVTNEQASRVQVGDPAEVSTGWWWSDLAVVLTGIAPDPNNPGQRRILNFSVSGSDIQAGQQVNISVGQRSVNYDLTVPNSAIREDSNGKFILIIETRSTPLANRYYASRVDVNVIVEDDNNSAISAGIFPYEYVITTATRPVAVGQQIRLSN